MSNQFVVTHQIIYQLETIAKQIAVSPVPACVVTDRNPNQLFEIVKQHQGCSWRGVEHNYHYVVGDLGNYACLHIASGTTIYSTHHWLITIALNEFPYTLLQIRIAKPVDRLTCSLPQVHLIKAGIISWRSMCA